MLSNYYYDGSDLCTQVLSMSDYFFASEGFRKVGQVQHSVRCLKWSEENMEYILTLPQYSLMKMLDIAMFADMSKQNQDHLVKNLVIDFGHGVFQIKPYDLKQAVMNYPIK